MNARRRRVLLIAAVCLLAIPLAAATLDSTVEVGGGGGGNGGDGAVPSPSAGEGADGGLGTAASPCVPALATPWAALGLLAVLGGVTAAVARRYGRFEAVAVTVGLSLPAVGLYLLVTACETGAARRRIMDRLTGGLPLGGTGGGTDPSIPLFLGAVVLVGAVVAGGFLFLALSDRGGASPTRDDDGEADADAGAAANAAGDAAERIDAGGDLESEIHRAWREMARHLDVARPAASTPREFASAAVDAGLDPGAVEDLTTLFEEVRYGSFATTVEREERARRALDRIEDSDEPGPDDEGATSRGGTNG